MLYPETVEVGISKLLCVMAASLWTLRAGYPALSLHSIADDSMLSYTYFILCDLIDRNRLLEVRGPLKVMLGPDFCYTHDSQSARWEESAEYSDFSGQGCVNFPFSSW